jgi:hypothetical protein
LQQAIQQSLQNNTFNADFSVEADVDMSAIEYAMNRVEEAESLTLPSMLLSDRPDLSAIVAAAMNNQESEESPPEETTDTEGSLINLPILKPTLADFFNLKERLGLNKDSEDAAEGSEDAGDAEEGEEEENILVAEIKAQLQGQLEEQLSGLPSMFFSEAVNQIIEQMNEALEKISVGRDVLAGMWKDATELIDYRNLTLNQAQAFFGVAFVDHEVSISQCSTLEAKFKEQTLGSFEFPVEFKIRVSNARIEMQGGRIKQIHVEASLGTGSLSLGENPLLEIPEMSFPLGSISLGAGVPVG